MDDETTAMVRRRPRLSRAQGRGAADGPAVGPMRDARGSARTEGRHVARGDFKTFRGAGRLGEGAALDAARPREARWCVHRGRRGWGACHRGAERAIAVRSVLWPEVVST
jgi:hypothetical protein